MKKKNKGVKKERGSKKETKKVKKKKPLLEHPSLYLTFENIRKYVSRNKYTRVYDNRKLIIDSFNYGQFARMTLRKLEFKKFRKWYSNAPSNMVRILLSIYFAKHAFLLTQRLGDVYIIMKEMIVDIIANITKKEKEYFDKCLEEGAWNSFCYYYDFSNETTPEIYNGGFDGLYSLD